MNVYLLITVFAVGALSSLIVSLLTDYVKNETLRYESVRNKEKLIETRRKMFEKSLKLSSMPDDFQLSVFDAEIVPVNVDESPSSVLDTSSPGIASPYQSKLFSELNCFNNNFQIIQ